MFTNHISADFRVSVDRSVCQKFVVYNFTMSKWCFATVKNILAKKQIKSCLRSENQLAVKINNTRSRHGQHKIVT